MPGPPARPTIIFDIDGTLVDTNYLHTMAWRQAMLEHDRDVPTWRIHRMLGASSSLLMKELLGNEDPAIQERWKELFDGAADQVRAIPGAAELLRRLTSLGAQVVLASSSPGELVDGHLRALGADDAIAHVTSDADVEEAKPSPEVFQVAMDKAGADPTSCLVIGDATWDVESARRAGLRTIGVLSGGYGRAELTDAGAIAVYDDVAQLLAELDRSPLGPLLDPDAARA
jgi:HAD superfamily hydrolase (TIGR01509 family)